VDQRYLGSEGLVVSELGSAAGEGYSEVQMQTIDR
jgi:hypothetical protein